MSWQAARQQAEALYKTLRATLHPGMIAMIGQALQRMAAKEIREAKPR